MKALSMQSINVFNESDAQSLQKNLEKLNFEKTSEQIKKISFKQDKKSLHPCLF